MRLMTWTAGVGAVVLLAVAMAAFLDSAAVFAHADYERSEPDRNEVLPAPPDQVDVWFTQDVRKREGFYFLRVFDEQGAQVSEGDGSIDDDDRAHIITELPTILTAGRYVVEWMTTSDLDGDDDEGAFCFYVAAEPTAEQEAECALFDDDAPATQTPPDAQPTEPADSPTATAIPADNGADDDDGGGIPVAAIVAIIAGVVVVLGAGAAAVWMRRD